MHCVEELRDLAGDDEVIALTPVCHPGAPLEVRYVVASEAIVVACSACGAGVVDVPVSTRRSLAQRRKRLHVVDSAPAIQEMTPAARKNRSRRR